MWAIVDIAIHTLLSKVGNYDTRDFSQNARIPSMYYQPQPDTFQNTRIYIPPDMYSTYNSGTSNTKKTGIVIPVSFVIDVAIVRADFWKISPFRQREKYSEQMIRRPQLEHLPPLLQHLHPPLPITPVSNQIVCPSRRVQLAMKMFSTNTRNHPRNDFELGLQRPLRIISKKTFHTHINNNFI